MEGLRCRRDATLVLHREFTNARLEKQILTRAFALVAPVDDPAGIAGEPGKAEAEQLNANSVRSRGGSRS
jgi:hypothetical protein